MRVTTCEPTKIIVLANHGQADRAKDATVLALTPLCVVKAEQQPDQLVLLKKESSWQRSDFVIKAGWVANVNDQYRSACASTVVEAMDVKPAK